MRRWAYVVVGAGGMVALASCSASPSGNEETSSVSQAAGAQFQPGTTARVCQLIGDTDYAARPAVVPTKGRTVQAAGVRGTDLGYPIIDNGGDRILFYFGDTNFDNRGWDVQGFGDLHRPDDGCPTLSFNGSYSPNASSPIITVDSQPRGPFQVPQGGVMDPQTRTIYLFYSITDGPVTTGLPFSRSVLTTASADVPNELHSVFSSPFNGAGLPNFYINAPIIVQASKVSSIPFGNVNPQDEVLLIYGASQPYRQGTVQLAAVKLSDVAVPDAYLYKTYTSIDPSGWTKKPGAARPIFDDENPPCAGELSVTYNAIFDTYMMSYVCGAPQDRLFSNTPNTGAFLRLADNPVGPWSPPTIIFDPVRDQALGAYMHVGNARGVQGQGGFARTSGDICSLNGGATYCCSEPAVTSECGPGEQFATPTPPLPPLHACITSVPIGCPSLANEENSSQGAPGCCTNPNACCDLAFTGMDDGASFDGYALVWGSSAPGGDYAPYLIQPYSQGTDFVSGSLGLIRFRRHSSA